MSCRYVFVVDVICEGHYGMTFYMSLESLVYLHELS